MDFNEEVSEKKDCLNSEKSFHDDANIETKVTLEIMT